MRRFLFLILAFIISAASCEIVDFDNAGTSGGDTSDTSGGDTSGTSGEDTPDPSDATGSDLPADENVLDLNDRNVVLASRLLRFNECDTLLDHIHTEYSQLVGPYGFATGPLWELFPLDDDLSDEVVVTPDSGDFDSPDSDDFVTDDSGEPTADGDSGSSLEEGVDFSGTNVQESGVDEADIVKTDGKRIFVISNQRLRVVDAASRTTTGSVKLASAGSAELLISGDNVLVIQRNDDSPWIGEAPVDIALPGERSQGPMTIIQRIDVSGDVPEVVSTLRVEGDYLTSRGIDGSARIVLRSDPHWQLPFVYPQSEAGESEAEEANLRAVLETTLDDWLPAYSLDDSDWQQLPACGNVHTPSEFSGLGLTTVLGLPIDGALDPAGATTVLAPGDIVYASATSLYTTSTARPHRIQPLKRPESNGVDNEATTSIHRFDISDPAKTVYVSSGDVAGTIHNQFSLSEHNGYLRVVTTTGDNGNREDIPESQVRVLQENGNRLTEIGQVGNIGKDEHVYSVRFIGDIGYVVTFRQIDPFYTIDLSDPRNPTIRGELKIPGFSSYLHPIGDGLVLGVGADATDEGRVTGSKVSLFDVSDLDDPREIATWTVPNIQHNVDWDHRAFLWWAPENLAVIPFGYYAQWSGAIALRIADGVITEIGWIEHTDDNIPSRGCRDISESVLLIEDRDRHIRDLKWMLPFGDGVGLVKLIACEPGTTGQLTGARCYDDDVLLFGIRPEDFKTMNIREDASLWVCGLDRDVNTIIRSFVIGSQLWTLSYSWWDNLNGIHTARLQANDIRTLERLKHITFE